MIKALTTGTYAPALLLTHFSPSLAEFEDSRGLRRLRSIGFLVADWLDLVGFLQTWRSSTSSVTQVSSRARTRSSDSPHPCLDFARFGGVRAVPRRKLAVFEALDWEVLCDFCVRR